jgi:hypothetical protein
MHVTSTTHHPITPLAAFIQVESLCDFSTNFCNMFNLYCNEATAPVDGKVEL